MKFLTAQLLHFLRDRPSRVNMLALLRFLAVLVGLVTFYSVLFHYLMAYEGRQESWITGFYWTLTVMSTLGFGDITFHSDVGRFFSIVVLLSGIIFLLILLPFTFIYLTIYCRRLRPDVQIISRARLERNVATLHRAGADFVLSYASLGANVIFNLLNRSNILMIAEGLDVFEVDVPASLAEQTIAESALRPKPGCSVVAFRTGDALLVNPDPAERFPRGGEMILIGTPAAEERFWALYNP